MTSAPFLVAGGGIAGLAASLGLARAGRGVRLFEQAAAFAEVGAGLQMSPNAVRALQQLGAWDAVEPHCVIPTEIHLRDGLTGARLQRIRLGKDFETRFGAPYRVTHRADLLGGLRATARSVPAISLENGARVTSALTHPDGAELRLEADRHELGAAVIAADGIRSAIRSVLHPGTGLVDHGYIFYRTLLPMDQVPPAIAVDAVTLWLLPGAHVVHYAVSNWKQFNVVAVVEGRSEEKDWSSPAKSGEVQQAFRTAAGALQDMVAAPPQWFTWRGADIGPLPSWSTGNIALAGDAAHATLPYLAQGAAMALEDAAVLSHCVIRSTLPSEALSEFCRRRQPRATRVQTESRRLGRIYHAGAALRLARNGALRLMPEAVFLNRLAWLYRWTPP